MKKLLIMASVLLVGCSGKEPLSGAREDLILTDTGEEKIQMDRTPVKIDEPQKNKDCSQSMYTADHYYGTLWFSKNPKLQWSASLKCENDYSRSIMLASAVTSGDKVFCADSGGIIYAFDRKSGREIWRKSTILRGKDGQIGVAMACYGDKLVVSSSFAEAFLFDSKNGEILWRIKLPAACTGDGITIYENKAFFVCGNSSTQAVDLNSGRILWSHSGMMTDTSMVGNTAAAVSNGVVFTAYPSGEVFALSENGQELWSATLSKFSFVNAAKSFSHPRACPIVNEDLVYFTNANRQISAIDVRSGEIVWKQNFGGVQTPAVSGNSVFIYDSESHEIVCLNKKTGQKKWSQQMSPAGSSAFWFGPVLTSCGLLLVSSAGNLALVSPFDGKLLSMNSLGDKVSVRPVIANGCLYLPLDSGNLVSYK